jgi:sugar transferase (PEP-CTERM/EpsH1 system associated)
MSRVHRAPDSATSKIKIAHIVLGLNVGGLERVVLKLLTHTDRTRYAPVVCVLDEPGVLAPQLESIGIPLRMIPRGPRLNPRLPMDLESWLHQEDARIVHTHNASPHLYGALAARLARLRLHARHFPRIVHTKHGRNDPGSRRKVLVNRIASSLTDRVVAVSNDVANLALELEHVRPDKVMTILNGVDTEEYRPGADPAAARERLGIPTAGFHVGCVARLAAVKDHRTLLDALAILRARRPDVHLTLIGDGPERRALEEHVSRIGLGSAVTFAGEQGDIASLLPAFDVFALSSRSEGISLTLLEAAAAGLPIVATAVGGNAEVVDDGETGLLVPPHEPARFAEAIEVIARREDRAEMGTRGREKVKRRFSVEQMARAYDDLYAELLDMR